MRERLDSELGVTQWRIYRRQRAAQLPEIEPGAPSWWHGDEEASAPFLAWARAAGWTGGES